MNVLMDFYHMFYVVKPKISFPIPLDLITASPI